MPLLWGQFSRVGTAGYFFGVLLWLTNPELTATLAPLLVVLGGVLLRHFRFGAFLAFGLAVSGFHTLATVPTVVATSAVPSFPVTVSGTVVHVEEGDPRDRLGLIAATFQTRDGVIAMGRIDLSVYRKAEQTSDGTPLRRSLVAHLKIGDRVSLRARLYQHSRPSYPGTYDRYFSSLYSGGRVSGFALTPPSVISSNEASRIGSSDPKVGSSDPKVGSSDPIQKNQLNPRKDEADRASPPPSWHTRARVIWQEQRRRLRDRIAAEIEKQRPFVGDDSPTGDGHPAGVRDASKPFDDAKAILLALTVADRSLLSDELWETARLSGIAHILAISGLHISIIVGGLFGALCLLVLWYSPVALYRRWLRPSIVLSASVLAVIYLLVVGAPLSATRATLFALIILFGVALGRRSLSVSSIAFAAMILLALNPATILEASFQLSFSAVTSIVIYLELTRENAHWRKHVKEGLSKPWQAGINLLGISVFTTLGTLPFVWLIFGEIPRYGFLTNLLAVPLVTLVVMPLVMLFLLGLFLQLGVITGLAWLLIKFFVTFLLDAARAVVALPGSAWQGWQLPSTVALLACVALWLMAVMRGRSRILGVIPLLCAVGIGVGDHRYDALISGGSVKVAIRDGEDGYRLIAATNRSFVVRRWRSQLGIADWQGIDRKCATVCVFPLLAPLPSSVGEAGVASPPRTAPSDRQWAPTLVINPEMRDLHSHCRYATVLIVPFVPSSRCNALVVALEELGDSGFAFVRVSENAVHLYLYKRDRTDVVIETFRNTT